MTATSESDRRHHIGDRRDAKQNPGKARRFPRSQSRRHERAERRDDADEDREQQIDPPRLDRRHQRLQGESRAIPEPIEFERGDENDRNAEDEGHVAFQNP